MSTEQKIKLAFGRNKDLYSKTSPDIQHEDGTSYSAFEIFSWQVRQKINDGDSVSEAIASVKYTREYKYEQGRGNAAEVKAKWYHKEFIKGLGDDDKARKKVQFKYYKTVKGGSLAFENLRFVASYSKEQANDHVEVINGVEYYIRQSYQDMKSETYIHVAFTDNDSKSKKVILVENDDGIRIL